MFKMVFLRFLYDLSDRQMEEQAAFNLVYKRFLSLSVEDVPSDFSLSIVYWTALARSDFPVFNSSHNFGSCS